MMYIYGRVFLLLNYHRAKLQKVLTWLINKANTTQDIAIANIFLITLMNSAVPCYSLFIYFHKYMLLYSIILKMS
mgnify:FL=1